MIRATSSVCLIFLQLLYGPSWALSRAAIDAKDSRFSGVNSPQIEFLKDDPNINSPGRYPGILNFAFDHITNWQLQIKPHQYRSRCEPNKVDQIFSLYKDSSRQAWALQSLMNDCETDWQVGSGNSLWNVVRSLSLQYPSQGRDHLQSVMFHLPGNVRLRGLLALKDGQARPLIIVRNGIFSSIEEFRPERAFLIHLFDSGLFHVLIVENMTSPDFILNNRRLGLGGLDEGFQNLWLSQTLQDPRQAISKLVSEVHLMGISLGGHGVLAAAFLNPSFTGPKIKSFTALCPVIDLSTAANNLSLNSWRGAMIDSWASKRIEPIMNHYPDLPIRSSFGFLTQHSEFMPAVLKRISENYKMNLELMQIHPLGKKLSQMSFWQANDFIHEFSETPDFLAIGTRIDPLVPWQQNSGKYDRIPKILFQQGVHCTLDVPYDSQIIAGILQGRVLSHMQKSSLAWESIDFELDTEWQTKNISQAYLHKLNINSEKKLLNLEVRFRQRSENLNELEDADGSWTLQLPAEIYDGSLNWPISDEDSLLLKRWIGKNLKLEIMISKQGTKILKLRYPRLISPGSKPL